MDLLDEARACYRQGDLRGAETRCREVLARAEGNAGAWSLLAQLAEHARQWEDALRFAKRGVELDPLPASHWSVLGDVQQSRREYFDAIGSYEEALRRDARNVSALNNQAAVHKALGNMPAALDLMRRALEVAPDMPAVRSNLLTMLLYDDRLTGEEVIGAHRDLGRWWSSLSRPREFRNLDDAGRRLRVGYVSPDLCKHAVMRFFEPILREHDRRSFEIFLYSECPIVDEVGKRLRGIGDAWRVTWMKSVDEVSAMIQEDGIDVLVDLAGHTRHNRLDIFGRRPAPVQMTYLGYPSVTGLEAIDYRLTDHVLDPEGSPSVEKLIRLPKGYACFEPPARAPEVTPAPVTQKGYLTFGSHHPLLKINAAVLKCWREILEEVSNARLMLFRSDFVGDARARLQALLREHGLPLDRTRIESVGSEPEEYLRAYEEVDVLLDVFPFGGHTMTCEALWMGVPTLTLWGDRPAARLSASVMTALGLDSFIARTRAEYVRKGVELARTSALLVELRGELRERVRTKLDGKSWTRGLEDVYREAWSAWRASSEGSARASMEQARSTRAGLTELIRLGEEYEQSGRANEALALYEEVNRAEPWNHEHPFRLGNLLTGLGEAERAEIEFRRTVAVAPGFFPGWAMLGQTYSNQGRIEESRQAFDQALALHRDPKALLVRGTLLPQIHESRATIEDSLIRIRKSLAELEGAGVRVDPSQGAVPNFFLLAYMGGDVHDLQSAFARLIVPPEALREMPRRARGADGRIRVGLVSEYFCNHTIGTLNRGLVRHLDRSKFHVTVLSATSARDAGDAHYARHADVFLRLPADIGKSIAMLRELPLEVLFFADLGMSCFTLSLAAMRFAPVQCVTWGHPLTTGFPTIDYFLSGELFEAAGAEEHYTEQLVRLSGLQTCYEYPTLPLSFDRGRFGLPMDKNWYGCPQTLFKFHPDFDQVLAGILRRDENGILVLIEGKHRLWTEQLMARWRRVMPDVMERVHFLPAMPRAQFLELCQACQVLLDPVEFGGGNTTLEGLAAGTPIVTLPSPYLRSRLAQGMFRHAGLEELIVASADEYVELATRLAMDEESRRQMIRRIEERRGELFEHRASIRAFEDFFDRAVAERARYC